ncbi:hypothetical protein GCM10010319_49870 [Streptomyces blastmyceticus]|uniref:Uncharacterized protein n=1 Tax=Streptomyces blastmyceticus TaxID=68180 RepID=A0ABN0XJP8_9ACTN
MKAVLSGDTATAAVPCGQPEPLTVAISITILSGGGLTITEGPYVENGALNSAAIVAPAKRPAGMALQSLSWTERMHSGRTPGTDSGNGMNEN